MPRRANALSTPSPVTPPDRMTTGRSPEPPCFTRLLSDPDNVSATPFLGREDHPLRIVTYDRYTGPRLGDSGPVECGSRHPFFARGPTCSPRAWPGLNSGR